MIKSNYQNAVIKPSLEKYRVQLEQIKKRPQPSFEKTPANISEIIKQAKKYKKYKNIILIGNGGSRTSAWAFYHSLFQFRNKNKFEFLASPEPELINSIRKKYSPKDTLVLVISKSGSNINNLEPLLLLLNYKVLTIAGEKANTLSEIADKIKGDIIIHPEVEGRFSGLTTCALVPAYLMGLNIEKIFQGAKEGYEKYNSQIAYEKNAALKLAIYLSEAEKKGYTEIFASIYSTALFGFFPLVTQLIHESAGKGGHGQTIYGDYSPESQHHTNQRFFGGRKNALGLFMGVLKTEMDVQIKVPKSLTHIPFKDKYVGDLDGLKASAVMKYDMRGVVNHAKEKKIPAIEIWVSEISEKSAGEFMVFWQYVAYYLALLAKVDPFNQPEVEGAKIISFNLRMKK